MFKHGYLKNYLKNELTAFFKGHLREKTAENLINDLY